MDVGEFGGALWGHREPKKVSLRERSLEAWTRVGKLWPGWLTLPPEQLYGRRSGLFLVS